MDKIRNNRIDEKRIRRAVHSKLLRPYHQRSDGTRVIDELGLDHGQSRIDIAVVNGSLHGIEIKSPRDNLSRLPSQLKVYNLYFNRVTLVFAENFYNKVMSMVPRWWGLVSVTQGQRGGIHLTRIRPSKPNSNVNSASIVKLLWRNEVIDLLRTKGVSRSDLRKPKSDLYGELLERINEKELRKMVSVALRKREDWHSH